MSSDTAQTGWRARLSPSVRRERIIDAAEALLLIHGGLPLPLADVARAAGVSKALIYAYFPTQPDLANALLVRRFMEMAAAGLEAAAARPDPLDAAQACADLYLEAVAKAGPVVHIILRDPFMAGRIDPDVAALRDRIARRLARTARLTLRLSPKEAVAAVSLMTTIPEETGRMVHAGDLPLTRGRELNRRLIGSSLRALTPDLG